MFKVRDANYGCSTFGTAYANPNSTPESLKDLFCKGQCYTECGFGKNAQGKNAGAKKEQCEQQLSLIEVETKDLESCSGPATADAAKAKKETTKKRSKSKRSRGRRRGGGGSTEENTAKANARMKAYNDCVKSSPSDLSSCIAQHDSCQGNKCAL